MGKIITKLPFVTQPNEITNDDYHNGEEFKKYVSSSILKNYMVSPKYAKYIQENPPTEKKQVFNFGNVYHDLLASQVNAGNYTIFDNTWFVFDPPINPSTGKSYGTDSLRYKAAIDEQRMINPGKEICSEDDVKLAKLMIEEMLKKNYHLSWIVRDFMKYGKAEQSHFCEYENQLFKFRTDILTSTKMADWKTVGQLEEAKEEKFSKAIEKFGYHISAAMYQFFDYCITGKWRKFFWIVQEKVPPYDFVIHDSKNWTWNIYKLDGEQTVEPQIGATIFLELLRQHIHCCETDEYPGYSVFIPEDWRKMRIAEPVVPGWLKGKMFKFYN